ncbi:F-box/kelch-repeat protein At3g23880-like [Sesamum indicum]|uniref:F-box/kelch-repeat protein At3g23880-like n=1 Tax=Sesamum indicum TaxID=4182 RepID=A0A6I9T0S5_SESIN|nr:F-box/kelch-repeat protein At3g23880-like [Sesamum indicum]
MQSETNHPQFSKIKTRKADQIPSLLPEEIVEEILSRLPVKSLLKFRCVSRSWYSLIGSKEFIKAHLEKSTKNTNFTHHRLVLNLFLPNHTLRHCSLNSLLNEPVTDAFVFDDPMYNPDYSIRIVGCCNGVICILIDRKRFFLWNPSTRMSKKLPDIDDKLKHGDITKFGFGVDGSGDYKVFAVLSVFWITGKYQATGNVYSLKTNSWRRIKDRDEVSFDEGGKFVSGKLHWGKKSGRDLRWDIVSFDLEREVYGVVEQPSYRQGGFKPSLGVLDGCLCVLCDYCDNCLDVWLLKEYGVSESWSKVLTIPYPRDGWAGPFSTPLFIGPERAILVVNGFIFVVYCPKDNQLSSARIVNSDDIHGAEVYVESLVSLVSDGE